MFMNKSVCIQTGVWLCKWILVALASLGVCSVVLRLFLLTGLPHLLLYPVGILYCLLNNILWDATKKWRHNNYPDWFRNILIAIEERKS
jgi:hypothetical protein